MRKFLVDILRFFVNVVKFFKRYPLIKSFWGVDNIGTYTITNGVVHYTSLHIQRRKEFPDKTYEENVYLKIGKEMGMFDKIGRAHV